MAQRRHTRRVEVARPGVAIVFPRRKKWEYTHRAGITVSSMGIPSVFRDSFADILALTRAHFRYLFGARRIGWVEMNVRKSSRCSHRLWTNGSDRIYLTLSRKGQLDVPQQSGVYHLHGLPHELGHIVLYRSLINIPVLPPGWGEGWAVFLASFIAVPHLFARRGPGLWPYSYDYLATEGPARYLAKIEGPAGLHRDETLRAVRTLHLLDRSLGRVGFARFFRNLLRAPMPADQFHRKVIEEARQHRR